MIRPPSLIVIGIVITALYMDFTCNSIYYVRVRILDRHGRIVSLRSSPKTIPHTWLANEKFRDRVLRFSEPWESNRVGSNAISQPNILRNVHVYARSHNGTVAVNLTYFYFCASVRVVTGVLFSWNGCTTWR